MKFLDDAYVITGLQGSKRKQPLWTRECTHGCQHALSSPGTDSREKPGSDLCFTTAGKCLFFFFSISFLLFINLHQERPKEGDTCLMCNDNTESQLCNSFCHTSHTRVKQVVGKASHSQAVTGLVCASYVLLALTNILRHSVLTLPLSRCKVKHRHFPHIILLFLVFTSPAG